MPENKSMMDKKKVDSIFHELDRIMNNIESLSGKDYNTLTVIEMLLYKIE